MLVKVVREHQQDLYECRQASTCRLDGKLQLTIRNGEPLVVTFEPNERVEVYAMNDQGQTIDRLDRFARLQ